MCDLETSRIGAPYIYDISSLRVNLDSNFADSLFSPFQIHCSITIAWSRGFSIVRIDDTNLCK